MKQKKETNFKKSLLIFILFIIVCFAAVIGIHFVLNEQIETAAMQYKYANQFALIPEADEFEEVEVPADLEGITAIYQAQNQTGYVFRSETKGFHGNVAFLIALASDGQILGINMVEHNETEGIGSRVADAAYLEQYNGIQDASSVDGISGATVTSNALKKAITQAQTALQEITK